MKYIVAVGLLIFGLVAIILVAPHLPSDAQDSDFSRQEMLDNIANNIILPIHQDFLDQTVALQEATTAFEDDPTLETLSLLQQVWHDTSSAWEKVTLFEMGRRTFVYHSQIDNNSAVFTDMIEDQILPDENILLDVDYLDGRGSSLKGLRTLEYLIFGAENIPEDVLASYTTMPYAERRMQYLSAAVDLLNVSAQKILDIWSPDGENYIADFVEADDGSSVQESISMLSNLMLSELEHVVQMNVGIALGGNAGEVNIAYATSPYSGYSIEQAISLIEALQQTFNGDSEDGNGLGFDDYLNFLDANYEDGLLSDAINTQMTIFLEALNNLNNLDQSALLEDTDQIQAVYGEGIRLLSLMKVDMAAQMGITITFSDLDGD